MNLIALLFENEYFKAMLSPELIAKVSYTVLIFGIAWAIQSKKVNAFLVSGKEELKEHFQRMETAVREGMVEIRKELSSFKGVVAKDLEKGAERMTRIEKRVEQLEQTNTPKEG